MPDTLRNDALNFLRARQAPMTESNLKSIMSFLEANPDKRPSYSSDVAPSSFAGSQSGADIEAAVERSMAPKSNSRMTGPQPPPPAPAVGNTNTAAEENLNSTVDAGSSTEIGTPGQQTLQSPQVDPNSGFVDPNNPPDPMAGVTNSSGASMLQTILPAAAGGLAAIAATRGQGTRIVPPPSARPALPAPPRQLAAPEMVGMQGLSPSVQDSAASMMQNAELNAVREGRPSYATQQDPRMQLPPAAEARRKVSEDRAVDTGRAQPRDPSERAAQSADLADSKAKGQRLNSALRNRKKPSR